MFNLLCFTFFSVRGFLPRRAPSRLNPPLLPGVRPGELGQDHGGAARRRAVPEGWWDNLYCLELCNGWDCWLLCNGWRCCRTFVQWLGLLNFAIVGLGLLDYETTGAHGMVQPSNWFNH